MGGIFFLLWLSFFWAEQKYTFGKPTLLINGTSILSDTYYADYLINIIEIESAKLKPNKILDDLYKHPYIEAARLSYRYPDKIIIRTDPYKFVDIPKNIKQIILNLCDKHQLTIQTLAVKCNLKFHIIENYINNNYILDNYYLHIILKGLNFDLLEYIKEQNEIKNKNIEDTSINMETY